MGRSSGTIEMSDIDDTKMQELFDFLAYGEIPEGIYPKHPPKLGEETAFSIIYFLQEQTGVLPDRWELCEACKSLYDSQNEGSSEENRCDDCRRD